MKNNTNPLLVMALSALSAGILISCVKPADDKPATDNDRPKVVEENSATTETTGAAASASANITPVEISAETEETYLTHVADDLIIPAYADAAQHSASLHKLAKKHCQQASVSGIELQELRDQWLVLAQAWASAEMINFGPAT